MTNGLLTLNNFSLEELSCNLIGCTDSRAINFDHYANVQKIRVWEHHGQIPCEIGHRLKRESEAATALFLHV